MSRIIEYHVCVCVRVSLYVCRVFEQALRRCPRREFAEALYVSLSSRGRSFLPLRVVITTMLQTDEYEDGIELVQTVYNEGGMCLLGYSSVG